MTRRVLIIVIILALLGLGAWFFFGRSTAAPGAQTLTNGLPFGSGGGNIPGTIGGQSATSTGLSSSGAPLERLFKISDAPVAGAVALIKNGSLVVRYVERATGHIYDVDPTSLTKTEIVNTTVPKVYQAVFKPDGSAVIFRTLRADGDTIDSTSIALIPPAGTSTTDLYTTKSSGLVANISSLTTGTSDIFYVVKTLPQITSALFDGSKAATIWSAAFNEWQLAGAGDTKLTVTANASASADGFSYSLTTKTGVLSKLLGPLKGLTVTPNSNLSRIAYSFVTGGTTNLAAEDLSNGATYTIRPATLAEKCIWSTKTASVLYCGVPSAGLAQSEPDLWYQGSTHYSDRIWRFDVDTDYANIASDPKADFNIDIDTENLFLSPDEAYLFFQNKNDLTLWALKLE